MVDIVYAENFGSKYQALGTSGIEYFDIRFHAIWMGLLEIHATKVENDLMIDETILGTNKRIKVNYSRKKDSISIDITD